MDITRKRIINPQRYLYALHPGDKFYIAVPLAEEDYPRLQFYGLLPDSPARIPIPRRAATTLNANGKWKRSSEICRKRNGPLSMTTTLWIGMEMTIMEPVGKVVGVISASWSRPQNLPSSSKTASFTPRCC